MKRRRLRREALVVIALSVLGLLLVGTMVWAVVGVFTTPPAVDTGLPGADSQKKPAETGAPAGSSGEAPISRPTDRENASYNILCCGTDVATGLSDTIVLVHLAPDGAVSAVQLPRDTYIEYNGTATKLNACVHNLGPAGAAKVLETALCIRIDYTVSVSTAAFAAVVDAVGGVWADIPFDMDYDDPYQNLHIHLKAGKRVLNGEEATQFVRYRSGYANGDLGRLDAQKQFLLSLYRTVREKLDFASVTKIITDVFPQVTTDMPLQDCLYFARRVLEQNTAASALTLLTAPGKALWTEQTATSYYVLGRKAMLDAVNTYLNVFDKDIPDGRFDPNRVFVKDGDDDFERIYTYAILNTETVTGE